MFFKVAVMTFTDLVNYNFSVDTAFSTVGGFALSLLLKPVITKINFLFFSLYFSTIICKSSFLVLVPLKSRKYNMKFHQIKSNIRKDICTSSVSNLLLLTASLEIFTFLQQLPFFKSCVLFQIKYLIVYRRKDCSAEFNCSIQLNSSHIINI